MSAPSAPPLRIALATYAAVPALQPDDELLATALRQAGADPEPVAWNDPAARWDAYDAVVLRSTWDYFLVPDAFRAWLDAREAQGPTVINPPAAVRWNLDKRYLRALAERGVPTVPTRWLEPGDTTPLDALLDEEGWDEAVVKPAVSAGAHETWRTARARAAEDAPRLAALVERGTVLVQPFVEEIVRDGEWSLLFYGGAYSHAARKRVRPGDFRVQHQFGGTYTAEPAPADSLAAAERMLGESAALSGVDRADLAYARVDGCVIGGAFHLMELEIVEPSLFLAQHPQAAERCAAAILAQAHRRARGPG